MITIYKYPLVLTDIQTIELPHGFKILKVHYQGTKLCLWAKVNTICRLVTVNIHIYGTGDEIEDGLSLMHISTLQSGSHVWHVFEENVWMDSTPITSKPSSAFDGLDEQERIKGLNT